MLLSCFSFKGSWSPSSWFLPLLPVRLKFSRPLGTFMDQRLAIYPVAMSSSQVLLVLQHVMGVAMLTSSHLQVSSLFDASSVCLVWYLKWKAHSPVKLVLQMKCCWELLAVEGVDLVEVVAPAPQTHFVKISAAPAGAWSRRWGRLSEASMLPSPCSWPWSNLSMWPQTNDLPRLRMWICFSFLCAVFCIMPRAAVIWMSSPTKNLSKLPTGKSPAMPLQIP